MDLGQKLRMLRHLEGHLRGLGRALTQSEVVHAIKTELHKSISQSYLSLIENGTRPHLSHASRQLLAVPSATIAEATAQDLLARANARSMLLVPLHHRDVALGALLMVSRSVDLQGEDRAHADSRGCLVLLGEMLAMPGLVDRLSDTLMPKERT